jgi:outer membrane protein OmpA-like peptidoglycan-associated protein
VKRALVRHSVEPGRLVVKSYGPNAPVEPSTTREGMARNRRVELWIVDRAPAGK